MSSKSALRDQSDLHVTFKKNITKTLKFPPLVDAIWAIFDSLVYTICWFMLLQRPHSQLIPTQQYQKLFFLTSEGISKAIITQSVIFRSGFHAKSIHFSPLHLFENLSILPFSPLRCDLWYVIALHTWSPFSESDTEDNQRFW